MPLKRTYSLSPSTLRPGRTVRGSKRPGQHGMNLSLEGLSASLSKLFASDLDYEDDVDADQHPNSASIWSLDGPPTTTSPEADNDAFAYDLRALQYSQADVLSMVVQEEDSFQSLKASLRKRGCVTNSYLKENMHFYIQHCKHVQRAKAEHQRKARRSKRSTFEEEPEPLATQNLAVNAAA